MTQYPALMAYIQSRAILAQGKWDVLHADERLAAEGDLADVAADLKRAQADYKRREEAKGHDGYPYNRGMGEFLGLDLNGNGENTGYYFASCIMHHYEFGVAKREAESLITSGRTLRVVAARSKADRKPCRFYSFAGPDQITIEGNTVVARNGKVKVRLSSNWSVETCLARLAAALRTGLAYGEG